MPPRLQISTTVSKPLISKDHLNLVINFATPKEMISDAEKKILIW